MPVAGQTILFAGGGSGGHISPGLAIAERLRELDPAVQTFFACSNRAIDRLMLDRAGVEFAAMPAAPMSLRPAGLLRFLSRYRRTKREASALVRDRRVQQVVALGGFVAAPVVAAAHRQGIPVTLVNLDAPPGKANRWMARHCDRVLSAVPLPTMPAFAERIVGLPVRRSALAPGDQRECRIRLGLDPQIPVLFVTGASQGARSVNDLMISLAAAEPAAFRGWQVYHLTGEGEDEPIRRAYAAAGIRAVVAPFLHEMGLAWGAAELAMTRAGANSVAEVAANAVPALFLPYPHHRDQHQRHNAQPLVDLGGTVVVEDRIEPIANVAGVGPILRELMGNPARRNAMRIALRTGASQDAAAVIARILLGKI